MTADRSNIKTLPLAIKDFFGTDTRQTMEDVKSLTDDDKEDLRVQLRANGYGV